MGAGVETSTDSWGPTNISSTFLDFSPDSLLLTLDVSEGMQNILGGSVKQCIKYQTILLADEGPLALGTWRSCSSQGSTVSSQAGDLALWQGVVPLENHGWEIIVGFSHSICPVQMLPSHPSTLPASHPSSCTPHQATGVGSSRNQPNHLPVGEKTKRSECSRNPFPCLTYPVLGGFV